jgi:hypothetical protein
LNAPRWPVELLLSPLGQAIAESARATNYNRAISAYFIELQGTTVELLNTQEIHDCRKE